MGRKEPRAVAKVQCSGKIHKIVLAPNGQLVLTHHSKAERRQWLEFQTIGGQSCRCMEIYQAWVKGTGGDHVFPPALQLHYNERKRPWRRWWYKTAKQFPIPVLSDLVVSFKDYAGKQTKSFRLELRDIAYRCIATVMEHHGFSMERHGYKKNHEYWVHRKLRPDRFFCDTFSVRIAQNTMGYVCYNLPQAAWFPQVIHTNQEDCLDLNRLYYEACFAHWHMKFARIRDSTIESEHHAANPRSSDRQNGVDSYPSVIGREIGEKKNKICVGAAWMTDSPAIAAYVSKKLAGIYEKLSERKLIKAM